MASKPCLILQFAASTAIAAMLSMAAPAVAAEMKITAAEARPVTAKTAHSHKWHHAWRGTRFAASRYDGPDRRVSPIPGNLDCSGIWCGRQYVLMIGIGF
jgi:hypothetical protein